MPTESPSRASTVSTSRPLSLGPSLAAVENTFSRMSKDCARSTSGTRRCVPAYIVPGRTPEIWLIRTAASPSGTTKMLFAVSAVTAAIAASFAAICQRIARRGPERRRPMVTTVADSALGAWALAASGAGPLSPASSTGVRDRLDGVDFSFAGRRKIRSSSNARYTS